MSVLTAGDDVAFRCLRLCLFIRVELLEADLPVGWIQIHRALVKRDLTLPTDGVGRRTPDRCLIVWRNVICAVCVELERVQNSLETRQVHLFFMCCRLELD